MASKYSTILLSILCFTCFCLAKETFAQEAEHVVVKGRVFCDTCGQRQSTDTNTRSIVGAVVAVECKMKRKMGMGNTSVEGKTDENGEFRVELSPSVVHSRCGVRLVSSPEESCNVPSIATPSHIITFNGLKTYNSPPLAFRPSSSCSSMDSKLMSLLPQATTSPAESTPSLLPPLPQQAPPLPLHFPPLPRTPPLLPQAPPLPLHFPPLPRTPPLPFHFPPLPRTPPLPNLPFSPPPFSIPSSPFSIAPAPAPTK